MSTEESFNAGKNGESWESARYRLGDSYQNRTAFESGKTARTYGNEFSFGNRVSGAGAGGIFMFLIMGVCIGIYVFSVIYSPFLLLALGILLPIWPVEINIKHADFILFVMALLLVIYLLSCAFEYFRARMIEARAKNQTWKPYYWLIFTVRIIMPGVFVSVMLKLMSGRSLNLERGAQYAAAGLIVSLILLWRVKVLKPNGRLYLTEWAYNEGVKRMNDKPYVSSDTMDDKYLEQMHDDYYSKKLDDTDWEEEFKKI